MRLNTTKNYFYLADYYSYTLLTSADGTVTTRQYVVVPQQVSTDITVNLNNNTGVIGDLVITSEFKMQLDGYLKRILDKNGDEVYEDGVWKITSTMPLLNSLGLREGYRYTAQLIAGNI
jgi:hypothetical protein